MHSTDTSTTSATSSTSTVSCEATPNPPSGRPRGVRRARIAGGLLAAGLATALGVSVAGNGPGSVADADTAAPAAATAARTAAVAASPSATPRAVSTRRLVIRAVTAEVLASTDLNARQFSVRDVRISRTDARWARATLVPAKGVDLDRADVLVNRARTGWAVADLGTAEVGCGRAPARELTSLGLACG